MAEDTILVKANHCGQTHELSISRASTISDLSRLIEQAFNVESSHQKLLIKKLPVYKPPFPLEITINEILAQQGNPSTARLEVRIMLQNPAATQELDQGIDSFRGKAAAREAAHEKARRAAKNAPNRWRTDAFGSAPAPSSGDSQYRFHEIAPLPHLPNPQASLAMLERLAADVGIKQVMVKHKMAVGLLTELDPVTNTSHSGKLLGLNRNAGETIELRLRTDSGDGYRDYKGVRDTLCHELAHNYHSEHDADFWALTKSLERDVRKITHGQRLSNETYYDPEDVPMSSRPDAHVDGGAWTGQSHRVGGTAAVISSEDSSSRRELLARAVEERLQKARPPE